MIDMKRLRGAAAIAGYVPVSATDIDELLDRLEAAEHQRDRLREALRKIDADLEGRNFLESSSLRDTARAALEEVGDE